MSISVQLPAEARRGLQDSRARVTGNCELYIVGNGTELGFSARAEYIFSLLVISPAPPKSSSKINLHYLDPNISCCDFLSSIRDFFRLLEDIGLRQ